MRTAKPITQILFQTFLRAFVLSILSACGSFQVQIENDVAGADIPAAQVAPVEVLVTRDTALFYLREIYGESIPPGDTVWTLTQMPSDGLVGASA
jgi:hypothetical protein